MNIPEALEMRLRAKRRDRKHSIGGIKKDCEYSQSFLRGSSVADKRVGPVSVEAPVWVKEEVPYSFWASVNHDSFSMQRTRAIQETAEVSVGGLIEEAIHKIKKPRSQMAARFFILQIILYSCFPYPTSRCLLDWGGHFYGRTVSECLP